MRPAPENPKSWNVMCGSLFHGPKKLKNKTARAKQRWRPYLLGTLPLPSPPYLPTSALTPIQIHHPLFIFFYSPPPTPAWPRQRRPLTASFLLQDLDHRNWREGLHPAAFDLDLHPAAHNLGFHPATVATWGAAVISTARRRRQCEDGDHDHPAACGRGSSCVATATLTGAVGHSQGVTYIYIYISIMTKLDWD
jgi:hypothetical protein